MVLKAGWRHTKACSWRKLTVLIFGLSIQKGADISNIVKGLSEQYSYR